MISFQKIYGLYGLKHHTVEINGNVTLEHGQTDRHVNIELEFFETEFAIIILSKAANYQRQPSRAKTL